MSCCSYVDALQSIDWKVKVESVKTSYGAVPEDAGSSDIVPSLV